MVIRDDKAPGKPVVGLEFYGSPITVRITDAGLKEVNLADFKSLTTLKLSYTLVTDAGLKELAGLKGLTTLNLGAPNVTDAGLKELAALKSLTTLDLSARR